MDENQCEQYALGVNRSSSSAVSEDVNPFYPTLSVETWKPQVQEVKLAL